MVSERGGHDAASRDQAACCRCGGFFLLSTLLLQKWLQCAASPLSSILSFSLEEALRNDLILPHLWLLPMRVLTLSFTTGSYRHPTNDIDIPLPPFGLPFTDPSPPTAAQAGVCLEFLEVEDGPANCKESITQTISKPLPSPSPSAFCNGSFLTAKRQHGHQPRTLHTPQHTHPPPPSPAPPQASFRLSTRPPASHEQPPPSKDEEEDGGAVAGGEGAAPFGVRPRL